MSPARFFLLFLSASCAASASEVATCDPVSDASCVNGGQDYQSMLQARVGVDSHAIETNEERVEDEDEATVTWTNLQGKSASQSSIYGGASASRAIDGNSANSYGSGSCTHTNSDQNAWWEVDLGSSKTISKVKITNRGDCCGSRLNGFKVLVDGTTCASNVAISQGQTKEVACSATGRRVKVQLNKKEHLTICEFSVAEAGGSSTVVTIGSSGSNKKCVNHAVSSCDGDAGHRGKRVNSHSAGDTFAITVEGGKVCARRTDSGGGWGMNLQVRCNVGQASTGGGPPPAFTMTSKYKCSKSDYSGHFWLYRDDVAAAFGSGSLLGKQFWVTKSDGTNAKGPYTIGDYNPNDAVDPASNRGTAYVSVATPEQMSNLGSSGLSRWDFKHKHYVGDKLYFQNPGSSTQSYCSNVDEICRCLEQNSYCQKVFNYDCNNYMQNIQECDKAADSCWSSASPGCKQQCVNAQWSMRDRYAKGCGCTDKHYWDFYGLLEEGEGSQDARSDAFGNSSNEISGEMQTSSLDDSITGKRTCR